MAAQPSPPFLCLQHLPRAGGSSVREWLSRMLPPECIVDCYWGVPRKSLEYVLWQYNWHAPQWRCLFGHFIFGTERVIERKGVYAILVREPVKRLISQFAFLRARDPCSPEGTDPDPERGLLTQLRPGNFQYDNLISRMIAGIGPIDVTQHELAAVAVRRVRERYALAATTLDYPLALTHLSDLIVNVIGGRAPPESHPFPHINSNPDPELVSFLGSSPRVIQRIHETQQADRHLYEKLAERPHFVPRVCGEATVARANDQ
jgi:hypothetical protein